MSAESASLSVSVVTYNPDVAVLEETLQSLARALRFTQQRAGLADAIVSLIDNGPGGAGRAALEGLVMRTFAAEQLPRTEVISGHGNIGYGRGHNLALLRSTADYHLVLNPDAVMREDALHEAICFMQGHPDVVVLAPAATDAEGCREYLCKRYPSVFDLGLRGFAPAWLKRFFRRRLERYELKSETHSGEVFDTPLASGCFMFLRRERAAADGGFSDEYFMYFEDYDLSMRMRRHGRLVCVPQVKIVHHGGDAAAKGFRHIRMFLRSALTFYNRNGWKLW